MPFPQIMILSAERTPNPKASVGPLLCNFLCRQLGAIPWSSSFPRPSATQQPSPGTSPRCSAAATPPPPPPQAANAVPVTAYGWPQWGSPSLSPKTCAPWLAPLQQQPHSQQHAAPLQQQQQPQQQQPQAGLRSGSGESCAVPWVVVCEHCGRPNYSPAWALLPSPTPTSPPFVGVLVTARGPQPDIGRAAAAAQAAPTTEEGDEEGTATLPGTPRGQGIARPGKYCRRPRSVAVPELTEEPSVLSPAPHHHQMLGIVWSLEHMWRRSPRCSG